MFFRTLLKQLTISYKYLEKIYKVLLHYVVILKFNHVSRTLFAIHHPSSQFLRFFWSAAESTINTARGLWAREWLFTGVANKITAFVEVIYFSRFIRNLGRARQPKILKFLVLANTSKAGELSKSSF